MKVTSMEEYGLRCMLQLALAQTDEPVSVALVAENEDPCIGRFERGF